MNGLMDYSTDEEDEPADDIKAPANSPQHYRFIALLPPVSASSDKTISAFLIQTISTQLEAKKRHGFDLTQVNNIL
jgi:hypothetical protein